MVEHIYRDKTCGAVSRKRHMEEMLEFEAVSSSFQALKFSSVSTKSRGLVENRSTHALHHSLAAKHCLASVFLYQLKPFESLSQMSLDATSVFVTESTDFADVLFPSLIILAEMEPQRTV